MKTKEQILAEQLQTNIDEAIAKAMLPVNDELAKVKTENEELRNNLTLTEGEVKAMKELAVTKTISNPISYVRDLAEKNKTQLATFKENKQSGFSMKANEFVDIITTGNVDGALPTTFVPGFIDSIRRRSNILSKISFGRMSTTSLAWYEYVCENGEYECVKECELKPAIDFTFERKELSVKKLAAHTQICDEAWEDIPYMSTVMTTVHQRLHDDKLASYVFEELKAISSAYLNPGFSGTVTGANDWDALLAIIASAKCLGCSYDCIAISCDKFYQLFATKDKDCRYITAPFFNITNDGRLFIMGVEVVEDKLLTGDEYLAGAYSEAQILRYKDFNIRSGYINDQLIHNAFTFVGESRFGFWLPCNRHICFQFDNLSTVLTDIDK